jgi:hypothetical protein
VPLQDVDPALPQVFGEQRLGLGREPAAHVSTIPPDPRARRRRTVPRILSRTANTDSLPSEPAFCSMITQLCRCWMLWLSGDTVVPSVLAVSGFLLEGERGKWLRARHLH